MTSMPIVTLALELHIFFFGYGTVLYGNVMLCVESLSWKGL